ncbi:hypothetical protein KC318_g51 [Hortaea werneckii]|nr:hypothetical protein KC318_g51 [Hortaea werneckii]
MSIKLRTVSVEPSEAATRSSVSILSPCDVSDCSAFTIRLSDRIASPKNSEERGSIQDAAAIDIFPSFSIRDRYRSSCACSNLTKPLWSVWAGSCFGPSMTIFPLPATCFSKSVPTSTIRDVGYETISNGGCRRLSKSANSRVR